MAAWVPTWLKDMQAYFANPNVSMYGRWNQPASKMEGGVDLTSPGGTPVYALGDGTIVGAGNFWHFGSLYTPNSGNPGYGVVTTRINVPGYGLQDWYVQHIDLAPSIKQCQGSACTGQVVHKGDLLGYVRSDVGEVETGFNADWGGIWGSNHPGKWATDPRPMLSALMGTGTPSTLGGSVSGSGGASFNILDSATWGPSLTVWGEYIAIFLIALVLIIVGFVLLNEQAAGKMIGTAIGNVTPVKEQAA